MVTRHAVLVSPLGSLTVVGDVDGLVSGLYFEGHRRMPDRSLFGDRDDAAFSDVSAQLAEYFAGRRCVFDVPIAPAGDDFQRAVWDLVRDIPYGRTRSYGELARELGDPAWAPAVGAANARNPLCVIVPCHRVVGADGALVGYAGGLARKRQLLALEEPAPSSAGRLF